MQEDITKQSRSLNWVRVYTMFNEIEASANAGRELLHRAVDAQTPHIISRAEEHLITLEEAGYTEIEEVQQFRHEVN